ncbi:MAG: ABC transporter substrate-binding protein [Actinomycetota bacterium]|nr:ABC transporter substrate-binding protein [Actinomycetota bacterium]
MLRRRAAVCGALLACFAAGCAGDGDEETAALSSGAPDGEGGTLVWAVAGPVSSLDPLEASTRAEQIVARQVNEPLTARLTSPFEPERRVAGLALRAESSEGDTVWTFRLRHGVTFQDGEGFDSAAVQANATRWLTTAAGNAILPDLVSVDAPSPGDVRFALSAPDPEFPKRLADPRLGIVSPAALAPASGDGAELKRSSQTGTGAFEVRERDASRILLARHTAWWGSTVKVDLGPALDQVEMMLTRAPSLRLAMLDAGDAQLADELDPGQADQAREDPLLSVLPSKGRTFLGLERSVRGIESGTEIPALSSAWLTGLDAAG